MSIMWADSPDPPDEVALVEDRLLDHHVLGVQAPAVVRVVGEEHVARGDGVAEARDRRLDRVRRRAEMEQDHPRAHDEIALRIHDRDRIVLGLGDGGGDGGVVDGQRGLFPDGLQPAADDLEIDRVGGRAPVAVRAVVGASVVVVIACDLRSVVVVAVLIVQLPL
jgi:hypothetical protein